MRDFLAAIDEGLSHKLPVGPSMAEIIEEHVRAYPPEQQSTILARFREGALTAREILLLRDHTYFEGLAGEAYDEVNRIWHYSLGG